MEPLSHRTFLPASAPAAAGEVSPSGRGGEPGGGGVPEPPLAPSTPAGVEGQAAPALDAADEALRQVLLRLAPASSEELPRAWAALVEALRAGSGGDAGVGPLLARLEGLAFQPGGDGADLRALLRALGAGVELPALDGTVSGDPLARLARALGSEVRFLLGPDAGAQPAADPLGRLVAQALSRADGGAQQEALQGALRGALDAALDSLLGRLSGRSVDARAVRDVARGFEAELQRGLEGRPAADTLRAALGALEPGALLRGREGLLLQALVARAAGPLGDALTAILARQASGGLEGELSAQLASLAADDHGAAAPQAAAVHEALELERLAAQARRRADGMLMWTLPFPDGGGWAALELLLGERDGEADASGEARDAFRVVVASDFSQLGPVRADLLMRPGSLALRLAAERPQTVERLRGKVAALEALLGGEGRSVVISITEVAEGEAKGERGLLAQLAPGDLQQINLSA